MRSAWWPEGGRGVSKKFRDNFLDSNSLFSYYVTFIVDEIFFIYKSNYSNVNVKNSFVLIYLNSKIFYEGVKGVEGERKKYYFSRNLLRNVLYVL